MLPAIHAEPRSALVGIVSRNPKKAEPYGVSCWTDLSLALAQSGADAVYVEFLAAAQQVAVATAFGDFEHVVAFEAIDHQVAIELGAEDVFGELMAPGAIGYPVLA